MRIDQLLFYYFLGVLAWAPLPLASNRDWSGKLLAGLLVAGLCVALLLAAFGKLPATPALRRARPAIALLCLVQVWVALQLALGISLHPTSTVLALWQGCGLVAGFVLTLWLLSTEQRALSAARCLVYCGTAQAAFAALMMLGDIPEFPGLDKQFHPGVASGTFINRNHLAGSLNMALALGIGLLMPQLGASHARSWRERLRRVIDFLLSSTFRLRLYLVLMVIALVLTRSRMGNAAFVTSLLACGALWLYLRSRFSWKAVAFLASLLVVDLLVVGQWFGLERVVQRIQNTSLETEDRDEVALAAVDIWAANPVTGTGANTFGWAYFEAIYEGEGSPFFRQAHNDYLEFGATYGLIGFIPLAAVVLLSLKQSIDAQRHRNNRRLRGLAFGCTMGICSLLVFSLSDFNLQIPANALWFIVLLGMAWCTRTIPTARR